MVKHRRFNKMNRKLKIPVCREAIPFLGLLLVLGGLFYLIKPLVCIIFLLLAVMVIYFFRDPNRKPPKSMDSITSPADGYVKEIKRVYEDRFIKKQAIQISIVLSLFDVHVTRSPIEGKIEFLEYEQGKFYPVFYKKSSSENKRNSIGIESKQGKVLVRLIAGAIARKIICFVKEREKLQMGQRLGLIVLGSRSEIILPLSAEILTKEGTKVRAGETVLARWRKP